MATVAGRQTQVQALRKPAFKVPRMSPGQFIAWLILIFICITFIIPLLWMISTSLKEASDLAGVRWIPTRLAWENYRDAFSFGMWPRRTQNTVIITVFGVIGSTISSGPVAYSFARLQWKARETLFSLVLATMMLPGVVTMIG